MLAREWPVARVTRRAWERMGDDERCLSAGRPFVWRKTPDGFVGPWPVELVECPYLFPVGEVVVSIGTIQRLMDAQEGPLDALFASLLDPHVSGDWGCLPVEDHVRNDVSLSAGGRLVSRQTASGLRFLVSTTADRSRTAIAYRGCLPGYQNENTANVHRRRRICRHV